MPTKHPIQPIEADDQGVMRFKENKIISDAVAEERIGLNAVARRGYSAEDRAQLCMLIGYSISGFGELSHVPRDLRNMIDAHALYPTDDNTPVELTLQDRVAHLERELARLRKLVAETAVEALVVTSENEEDIRTAVANLAADALDVHPSHIDECVAEAREARGLTTTSELIQHNRGPGRRRYRLKAEPKQVWETYPRHVENVNTFKPRHGHNAAILDMGHDYQIDQADEGFFLEVSGRKADAYFFVVYR